MNVGVGVPWGGRAAETLAVKARVAQRMRVPSCMAAVRLEEAARELRCMELEMKLNVCPVLQHLPNQKPARSYLYIHPPSSLIPFLVFEINTRKRDFTFRLVGNRKSFNETVMTMKQI
jgi:hypothetical protein